MLNTLQDILNKELNCYDNSISDIIINYKHEMEHKEKMNAVIKEYHGILDDHIKKDGSGYINYDIEDTIISFACLYEVDFKDEVKLYVIVKHAIMENEKCKLIFINQILNNRLKKRKKIKIIDFLDLEDMLSPYDVRDLKDVIEHNLFENNIDFDVMY